VNVLSPSIVASKVRFVPHSQHPRTVCMRVEVFGCRYEDDIVSYSAPPGRFCNDFFFVLNKWKLISPFTLVIRWRVFSKLLSGGYLWWYWGWRWRVPEQRSWPTHWRSLWGDCCITGHSRHSSHCSWLGRVVQQERKASHPAVRVLKCAWVWLCHCDVLQLATIW